MNVELLLDTGIRMGRLLLESGAEIYRVEDTMVRLCASAKNVQYADSYVMSTGLMLSFSIDGKTYSKVCRVRNRNVNLNCIAKVNDLSRRIQETDFKLEDIVRELDEIEREPKYSIFLTTLFGGVGAAGFAMFFDGNITEILISFFIGIITRLIVLLLSKIKMNDFINNALGAFIIGVLACFMHEMIEVARINTLVISGIMLLIPGLAITNAIRDSIAGDFVSGLSRATEALVSASAIAVGVIVALKVVM